MTPAEQNPAVAALAKTFIFKNIWTGKVVLHGAPSSQVKPIHLGPGEEVELTGHEFSTHYGHSIKVFRDCSPQKLEMREKIIGGKRPPKVEAPKTEDKAVEAELKAEESVEDAAARIKTEIKTLEAEYKADHTLLDRKQTIKKEILAKRKALKSLK